MFEGLDVVCPVGVAIEGDDVGLNLADGGFALQDDVRKGQLCKRKNKRRSILKIDEQYILVEDLQLPYQY